MPTPPTETEIIDEAYEARVIKLFADIWGEFVVATPGAHQQAEIDKFIRARASMRALRDAIKAVP